MLNLREAYNEYCNFLNYEKGCKAATILHHGKTYRKFTDYLKSIKPEVAEPQLYELSENNLRLFLLNLKENGAAPRSLLGYFQDLKAFCNFLLQRELITKQPFQNIIRPKLPKSIPDFLTEAETKDLMRCVTQRNARYKYAKQRDIAVIATFIFAGLRRKEVLNLKLNDVNLAEGYLTIRDGKMGKDREVPLCSVLSNYLQQYLELRRKDGECNNFFLSREDEPYTSKGLYLLFGQLNKKLNLQGKKLRPHLLRHTLASLLLRNGGDIFSVSKILGHSDISTTVRYYVGHTTEQLRVSIEKHHPLNIKI